MGGALARAWVNAKSVVPADLTCTAKSPATLERLQADLPGIATSLDNKTACADADFVFVCVKPWLVETVAAQIAGTLKISTKIVSVVAGISLEDLAKFFGVPAKNVFRAMPNTAVACAQSMTFLCHAGADEAALKTVCGLFDDLGKTKIIGEEKMSAGMALASCGIAYAMRYVRAATEGGVELGFTAKEAEAVVLQTLRGAVEILEQSGQHPEEAIDRVTTPGGFTIRGLNAMEAAGFTPAVIAGLKASN